MICSQEGLLTCLNPQARGFNNPLKQICHSLFMTLDMLVIYREIHYFQDLANFFCLTILWEISFVA